MLGFRDIITLILNIVLKLTAIHKIYMTECIQFGEMTQQLLVWSQLGLV